jgi:uncharacterized OB-fold protein
MSGAHPDWTQGVARIVLGCCRSCSAVWYLPRNHCPECGARAVAHLTSRGVGRCVAVTYVHVGGAAAPASGLAMVELDEGAAVLTTVLDELAAGDRVRLEFIRTDDGRLVPASRREARS